MAAARALSVSRASVRPEAQSEYLAVLGRLAVRLRARGESFWLFRHPTERDIFLEFSESRTPELHGSRAPRDREVADLEDRLRALAAYAPDARVLWQEVSLEQS